MKLNQLILPAVALGAGAAFLLTGTEEARGWSTIGGSLSQSQRDFRIYNNFTGGGDNNNQTYNAQFPNYYGADMAIWKACVEWSSIAHGDGSGDPTQTTIGSGGANFDPSFQGSATAVGNSNQNIHSQISGSSGGTLAYCETPISDGWRIRYYEDWNWADGPGGIGANQEDLQSVACHEYGHALGLGHSGVNSATMSAFYSGGTGDRSINSDDQAGVQAVYGSMSGTKPTINGMSINGSQITITGTNFSGSSNEVWFTQAGAGGNGTPIKVTGVTSNGTSITVTVPGNAGSGDVLVRKNSTAHSGLSNPWPLDTENTILCDDPSAYCTSEPNSVGSGASIGYSGSSSLSANDLTLTVTGLPPNVAGIFFYGNNQTASLFGEGVLCVQGNIVRMNVQFADILGTVSDDLDLNSPPFVLGNGAAVLGETKNFQFWYRDTMGGPEGFNTSDGLEVTWCE